MNNPRLLRKEQKLIKWCFVSPLRAYFSFARTYLSKWACCILINSEVSRLVCVSFYSALFSDSLRNLFWSTNFLALFVAHEWQRLTLLPHGGVNAHDLSTSHGRRPAFYACVEIGRSNGCTYIEMFGPVLWYFDVNLDTNLATPS